MNKLITDRPSEWKDWIVEAIGNLEEGMKEVDCIGMIVIPKDIRNEEIVTSYYNTSVNDMMLMKGHIEVDIVDGYIKENIEKHMPNEITFTPEDDYSENE